MTPIGVLIADDEPIVREGIAEILAEHPDFDVVAEAGTGEEVLEMVARHHPGLMFLDVQMPTLSGLEVLASLPPDETPSVIFVTAYDRYAVEAFEHYAIDYLLKPFDRSRFMAALSRARSRLYSRDAQRLVAGYAPLEGPAHQRNFLRRFVIPTGGVHRFLPATDVDWLEAAGNYVRLHAGRQVHLVRSSLKAFAEQLDPSLFAQIHRRSIVNLTRVHELRPLHGGDAELVLLSGAHLMVSRTFRRSVERRMTHGTT